MYSRRTHRRMQRRKKSVLGFVEFLLIVLSILLIFMIGKRFAAARETMNEERAAADLHQSMVLSRLLNEENPKIQPEIAELMEKNGDAVGLLHFGEDRTLYVCQAADNSYYMTHRFDRSEDPAGMIFMDYRNSLMPRSDNLILYGHNMRNGSRFGTLKRFEKKAYVQKYPIIQFADRYETVDYVPFAVFHTTVLKDDANYYGFDVVDFADDHVYQQYVQDVKARSVLEIPIEVENGDRLLTLVTCHSGLERGRLVIVCREVKAGDPLPGASFS